MARGSRCILKITGYEEILQEIENSTGEIEGAIERAMTKAGELATQEYLSVIEKHRYSGITEETLVMSPKIKKDGTKISMKTGFDLEKGGMASIYLDMGTPKQRPLKYVARIKRSKKIKEAIEQELLNVLEG